MFRRKITKYALYIDQQAEDGVGVTKLKSEGFVSPYVKNYRDIEVLEDSLMKQVGAPVKITMWYPISVTYQWFPFLKRKKTIIP